LFTLVHAALLLYAWQRQQERLSHLYGHSYCHSVAYQEDSVNFELEPKPLTTAQKLAILLNLPALVLAIPIAIAFHASEVGMLCAAVPFVPILWYLIGRWLDGILGYIKRSPVVPRIWSRLFAVVSACLLTISALTVTPLNHHRTTDTYWVGTASAVWLGLLLAICVTSSYRRSSN
jgi:hypothetical protein